MSDSRYLEIDCGRYLAIDDNGDYCFSSVPQAFIGKPLPPVPHRKGARYFKIDHGDYFDTVAVGVLIDSDDFVVVAGDKILDIPVEEGKEKIYVRPMFTRLPKKLPPNMSRQEILIMSNEEAFARFRVDFVRAGYKPTNTSYFRNNEQQVERNVGQEHCSDVWSMEKLNLSLDAVEAQNH
ncbi:hypothetical protein OROMI_007840 [Orobanche minor]